MSNEDSSEVDPGKDPGGAWVPVEDRADSRSIETTQPSDEITGSEYRGRATESSGDDGLYPWAPGQGSTSGDTPSHPGRLSDDVVDTETDAPTHVQWLGQIGIYLGVIAVFCAGSGVTLAALSIQPSGNILMVLSLIIVTGAMLLGLIFQAYASDVSLPG